MPVQDTHHVPSVLQDMIDQQQRNGLFPILPPQNENQPEDAAEAERLRVEEAKWRKVYDDLEPT